MNKDSQLYRVLAKQSRVAINGDGMGGVRYKESGGLPIMYWPDDKVCWEVNLYLLSLFRKKRYSLINNGGTLDRYASHLTALVRFLYHNRIDALGMTDMRMEQFVNGLSVERLADGSPRRNANTIRKIGSRSIDFINFHACQNNYPDFVGEEGLLRAIKTSGNLSTELRKKARGLSWYHECFPSPSPDRRRFPITDHGIAALEAAAEKLPHDRKRRTKILLSVLEHTGCRREEAASIMVWDLIEAYDTGDAYPLIKLVNLKRVDHGFREVPVPRALLGNWIEYIHSLRRGIVNDTKGPGGDSGFLFINNYTGNPLATDTLTNEIHDLRKLSGLKTPAHAHMFRHRFITEQFKRLIIEYDALHKDPFRRALINPVALKQQVQQWSGHSRMESLDRYIHLAFREIGRLDETVRSALFTASIRTGARLMDELEKRLESGELDKKSYDREVDRIFQDTLVGFRDAKQAAASETH